MLPTVPAPAPQQVTGDTTAPAAFAPIACAQDSPAQSAHQQAPVPVRPAVSTPLYEEMVAEWAAFGRHYPGAEELVPTTVCAPDSGGQTVPWH